LACIVLLISIVLCTYGYIWLHNFKFWILNFQCIFSVWSLLPGKWYPLTLETRPWRRVKRMRQLGLSHWTLALGTVKVPGLALQTSIWRKFEVGSRYRVCQKQGRWVKPTGSTLGFMSIGFFGF
jgi:hypothetical protein